MPNNVDQLSRILGNIEGELKGINQRLDTQGESINGIRDHLHEVDKRTVRHGAYAGFGVSIGVNVIAAALREYMKTHGA